MCGKKHGEARNLTPGTAILLKVLFYCKITKTDCKITNTKAKPDNTAYMQIGSLSQEGRLSRRAKTQLSFT